MDKIEELLTRGVDRIYPTKQELEEILRSGKKLRIYEGFDPTRPELHLGHLIGLRKLRQWQELGHEIIFLIGDFTGMVGDPTGKDKTRSVLTKEQVLENAKTYKEQASKVLDFGGKNPALIKYNSEWLAKLSVIELTNLTRHLSYQQIIERDMFQNRLKNNMDIALSEFFYPFMQGYDSVAMDVDVEVGGSDQTFNMLIGRKLMRNIKKKEKFVMTTPLLVDSSGVKIGKTEGNVIALNDKPEDLYRKIMALGDEIIVKGLEYLTDVPMEEIQKIQSELERGANPVEAKKKLAYEVVKELHNKKSADEAQERFTKVIQQENMIPVFNMQDIPMWPLSRAPISGATIVEPLMNTGTVSSRSEIKRLIDHNGISLYEKEGDRIREKRVTDINTPVNKDNTIIGVGKKFVKIIK